MHLQAAFSLFPHLLSSSDLLPDAGAAAADVEAALVSRSICDGQGLFGLTADNLIALQLSTPALRLLHASLDALRLVISSRSWWY